MVLRVIESRELESLKKRREKQAHQIIYFVFFFINVVRDIYKDGNIGERDRKRKLS
jgi:hypothetical protein